MVKDDEIPEVTRVKPWPVAIDNDAQSALGATESLKGDALMSVKAVPTLTDTEYSPAMVSNSLAEYERFKSEKTQLPFTTVGVVPCSK
jgi:hypothetical protein